MPRVIGPDGRGFVFPDGTPQAVMHQALTQYYAQHAPVSVKGTAQSFGSGIVKGVTGLLDSNPMDPANLGGAVDIGSRVLNWIGSKTGIVTPQQGDANVAAQVAARRNTPFETHSEAANRSGLLHNAQNSAERFADTAGQFVPNAFVPGGAGKTLLGKVAARIVAPAVGATVAPAAVKALGGNETAQNIAGVGGAILGGGAPNAFKAGGTAIKAAVLGRSQQVAPEVQALAQAAIDKHRIALRSDQIANAGVGGDKTAGIRDSNLAQTDTRFQASNLAQHKAFTNAVAGTFGETGPLSTDTMAAAKTRLGAKFDALANRSGVAYDPALKADLAKISQQAADVGLSDNEVAALNKQIDNIHATGAANAEAGVIPGDAYQGMTQSGSTLSTIIGSGHGAFATQGKAIREALNNAAARAGGPEAAAELADTRRQYANMKAVQPLTVKGTGSVEGLINPRLLQARVNATYKNAAYGSGGDLKELGDIGQTFLTEPANSQTTPRGIDRLGPKALGLAVAGLGGEGALALSNPTAAASTLGAGAVAYGVTKAAQALKAARSNNALATANLLTHGAPVPARIINAFRLQDPLSYAPQALIPGAISAGNALQSSPQ